LSEAFAEFSALWFVQFAAHDNRSYFGTLEEWRKLIVGNRTFVFGSGQQASPIWLGGRTESSTTEGDYGLIIYEKGAWVLHMLRNLMLDLDTMKEDRFNGLMREFRRLPHPRGAAREPGPGLVLRPVGLRRRHPEVPLRVEERARHGQHMDRALPRRAGGGAGRLPDAGPDPGRVRERQVHANAGVDPGAHERVRSTSAAARAP